MADKESSNGGKGKGLGGLVEELKEQTQILKGKAKEEIESLKKPEKTQLFKSMFRVKHDDSDRSRALGVLSNVFFHLHPAKINRDAVRYRFTWGMGAFPFSPFLFWTSTAPRSMSFALPTSARRTPTVITL